MQNKKFKSFSSESLGQKDEIRTEKKEKDETRISKLVSVFVELPIYLMIVLLPMFFYDNIPSPLELNKQAILVALVGISILVWIGKMAWKNEIRFKKSFILIPVITFLLIYGLSTVFSGYYEQSMWGYFGGEGKSFVSMLFLVAFFIVTYNNIKNYKGIGRLLFSFLAGGLILVVFGVLQFFEVYTLPFEFTQNKFFSPIGSIYIYSIYLALIFLVAVSLFLSNVSKWMKVFLVSLSIMAFFLLMVINFKVVWIVLLVMLAFILGMNILIENKKPSQLRVIPMIFLILTLLFLLRGKPLLNNSELPVEVFLKHSAAAEISFKSIKSDPLLGGGPTTFSNVYKQNRPSDLGDFSVINFNESSSFFLTLASTMGILGIISFLFLIVSGVVFFFREMVQIILTPNKSNNLQSYLGISVGVAWLFLTIFLFLYSASIALLMFWWLFFSLLVSMSFLNKKNKDGIVSEIATTSDNPKTSFFLSFGFVLVIIAFVAVIYLQGQKYVAAIYFNQALIASGQEGEINAVAEKISKAVSLDPNRDLYFRDLSMVHLALAKEKIVEKGLQNLSPEEANYVSTRFRSALQSLNQSKILNPADSQNFLSMANLYEEFILIQKDSGEKAIENYQKAIELDPKNPEIYQSMANVQITLSDLELIEANSDKKEGDKIETPQKSLEYLAMAEDYLKKALAVKADYLGANILLVTVYEKQNNIDKAIEKSKENIDIYPNSAELYLELGRIYYQQENFEEAEVVLVQTLGLNNQYSNARYLLGLTLDKKGDKEGSLAEFKKIQESNPDNELLKKIITNLENDREALADVNNTEVQQTLDEESKNEEEQTEISPEELTENE